MTGPDEIVPVWTCTICSGASSTVAASDSASGAADSAAPPQATVAAESTRAERASRVGRCMRAATSRKGCEQRATRPRHLHVARGLHAVGLRHLERDAGIRKFELRRQPLAVAQLGNLVGPLCLLDGAGAGGPGRFGRFEVLQGR